MGDDALTGRRDNGWPRIKQAMQRASPSPADRSTRRSGTSRRRCSTPTVARATIVERAFAADRCLARRTGTRRHPVHGHVTTMPPAPGPPTRDSSPGHAGHTTGSDPPVSRSRRRARSDRDASTRTAMPRRSGLGPPASTAQVRHRPPARHDPDEGLRAVASRRCSAVVQVEEFARTSRYRMTIQVAPDDCTGCGLCVDVCPAKSKTEVRHKSINMEPGSTTARRNGRRGLLPSIPELRSRRPPPRSAKGSQALQPLFEFSGACAGCGETPTSSW